MNPTEPIASSWLEPQIGFQLAHEQFKVPELIELGIAADQAGFDLLAVSEAAELWRFGPKAWKPYVNIRDPIIQEFPATEVPLEKVTSGATGVNIHSGQRDQRGIRRGVIDLYRKEVFA